MHMTFIFDVVLNFDGRVEGPKRCNYIKFSVIVDK